MAQRRIIFTGQAGLRLNQVLSDFSSYVEKRGRGKPTLIDFEKEMIEVFDRNLHDEDAVNKGVSATRFRTDILSLPVPIMRDLWDKTMGHILDRVQSVKDEDIFLRLHACFYHLKTVEYLCPINIERLKAFTPHSMITFTDDVYDVHERLKEKDQIFQKVFAGAASAAEELFELFRILDWRSKETLIARLLANELNLRPYVLAIKHRKRTLFDLIESDERKKVYISHPISEIRRLRFNENPEAAKVVANISELEVLAEEKIVGFFPTTIDELRIKNEKTPAEEKPLYYSELTQRWDQDRYSQDDDSILFIRPTYKPKENEQQLWNSQIVTTNEVATLLEELAKRLLTQITNRDYKLVEQSDCLLVYRPCFNGNPSRGVRSEIEYHDKLRHFGTELKQCFVYAPRKDQDALLAHYLEKRINSLQNEKKLSPDPYNGKCTFTFKDRYELVAAIHDRIAVKKKLLDILDDKAIRPIIQPSAMQDDSASLADRMYDELVSWAFDKRSEKIDLYHKVADGFCEENDLEAEEVMKRALVLFGEKDTNNVNPPRLSKG